jgi:predicted HicB family RNase H-like nuclease
LGDTTKMTVYVKTEIHTNVKVLAAQKQKKISDIVEEALMEYLEKHKAVK